jgi:hypothetical protein
LIKDQANHNFLMICLNRMIFILKKKTFHIIRMMIIRIKDGKKQTAKYRIIIFTIILNNMIIKIREKIKILVIKIMSFKILRV